jgi:hypothetical protein
MKELIGLAKSIDERLDNFSKAVDMNILEKKNSVEENLKKQRDVCSYLFGFLN